MWDVEITQFVLQILKARPAAMLQGVAHVRITEFEFLILGWVKERLLSCEKVLLGCTWLMLSNTEPFFRTSLYLGCSTILPNCYASSAKFPSANVESARQPICRNESQPKSDNSKQMHRPEDFVKISHNYALFFQWNSRSMRLLGLRSAEVLWQMSIYWVSFTSIGEVRKAKDQNILWTTKG